MIFRALSVGGVAQSQLCFQNTLLVERPTGASGVCKSTALRLVTGMSGMARMAPFRDFRVLRVGGVAQSHTHILEEYNLVKISSKSPQKTRFTNKVRVSFFGMF